VGEVRRTRAFSNHPPPRPSPTRGEGEADERRVAVAPVGDGLDEPEVRRAVARRDGERRIHGPRISKRHAEMKAECLRRIVHRHEAQCALDKRGDDKRRTIRR
jgi:hypothetical protein